MIPKRSWATLVNESVYEYLRDLQDNTTAEISVIQWNGETPAQGDTIYLIKPKTGDRYKDGGVFCVGTLQSSGSGIATIRLNADSLLTRKNVSYFRFDSLNLKDRFLRGLQGLCNKVGFANFLANHTSIRLEILFLKTDEDFSALDAKISLLAYEQSFAAGINPESSAFTVEAAIECGRLVSSVSSKMSNFKHLDERVEGGLPNGAKIDKITWNQYYQTGTKLVDIAKLRQDIAMESKDYDFTFVVEDPSEPGADVTIPNDDNTRQAYARRVRKGQSRFRKALHTLYGSRCAFTGTSEETVLEACHIISHARTGDNSLDNGLLLRSDIHILFDENMMTLANDGMHILVHKDVTAPEYVRLSNSVPGLRPSTSQGHLTLIRQRNSELTWAN